MLTKEKVFKIIENDLLPVIKEYNETKKLNITFEQRQLIKKVWENMFLGQTDVNCFSCLIHSLQVIESFFEREKPKEVKEVEKLEEVKPIAKPVNKGGRPRKNK